MEMDLEFAFVNVLRKLKGKWDIIQMSMSKITDDNLQNLA